VLGGALGSEHKSERANERASAGVVRVVGVVSVLGGTGRAIKGAAMLAMALAALAPLVAAMPVRPETALGGCGEAELFARAGSALTGVFWRGPGGRAYCRDGGGAFVFLVDGQCSAQAVSCDVRVSAGVADAAGSSRPQSRVSSGVAQRAGERGGGVLTLARSGNVTASVANLVLMVRFRDHAERALPALSDYEALLNGLDGPDGRAVVTESVRSYYRAQSQGRLDIVSVLSGWVDVGMNESDAAGGCRVDGLACCNGLCSDMSPKPRLEEAITTALTLYEQRVGADALRALDSDGDGRADMLTVLHSGFGAEATGGAAPLALSIWSHKWFLNSAQCPAGETDPVKCPPFEAPLSGLKFQDYSVQPGVWYEPAAAGSLPWPVAVTTMTTVTAAPTPTPTTPTTAATTGPNNASGVRLFAAASPSPTAPAAPAPAPSARPTTLRPSSAQPSTSSPAASNPTPKPTTASNATSSSPTSKPTAPSSPTATSSPTTSSPSAPPPTRTSSPTAPTSNSSSSRPTPSPSQANATLPITRVGVLCHEIGHLLGLSDLYDGDYSSLGVGGYDVMSSAWGLDHSQNYPPSLCAPSKLLLGWLAAPDLLRRAKQANRSSYSEVLQLTDQRSGEAFAVELTPGEFFLIENRQPLLNDALLFGGALVWQVDTAKLAKTGNDQEIDPTRPESWAESHPAVRLLQPDGRYDLERWNTFPHPPSARAEDAGDWFPWAGANGRQSDVSDAAAPMQVQVYAKLGSPSGVLLSEFERLANGAVRFRFTFREPSTSASVPGAAVQAQAKSSVGTLVAAALGLLALGVVLGVALITAIGRRQRAARAAPHSLELAHVGPSSAAPTAGAKHGRGHRRQGTTLSTSSSL
jgi:hypothetical protein